MAERIGILTGGGDCAGLNAVIRAIVKSAAQRGWETVGIHDGFEGLLDPVRYEVLDPRQMDDLLRRGGTILGTTNKGAFAAKVGHGETRGIDPVVVAATKRSIAELGLKALVCIGGDGTLSIALQLWHEGIPVVGVPRRSTTIWMRRCSRSDSNPPSIARSRRSIASPRRPRATTA
jgi:6-phosphofructokinase 1